MCLCNYCHWLFLRQESGEDPKGRWTGLTTCMRASQRRRIGGEVTGVHSWLKPSLNSNTQLWSLTLLRHYSKTQCWKVLHLKFLQWILMPPADHEHEHRVCLERRKTKAAEVHASPAALNGLSHHVRQWLLANVAVGALHCDVKTKEENSTLMLLTPDTNTQHCISGFPHILIACWQPLVQSDPKQSDCSTVGLKQINSSHWDIRYYLQFTSYTYRGLFLKLDVQHTLIFRSIFKIHHMLFKMYHPSPFTMHDTVY